MATLYCAAHVRRLMSGVSYLPPILLRGRPMYKSCTRIHNKAIVQDLRLDDFIHYLMTTPIAFGVYVTGDKMVNG